MATNPTLVTGIGAAVSRSATTLLQPRADRSSNPVEDAMANEIGKIQAETDAIARRTDIDDAEKNRLISALNDPAAMRSRILHARDVASGKVKA